MSSPEKSEEPIVRKSESKTAEALRAKQKVFLLATALLPDLEPDRLKLLLHSKHFLGDTEFPPAGVFEAQRFARELSGGGVDYSPDCKTFAWVNEEARQKAIGEMKRDHFEEYLDILGDQMWLQGRRVGDLMGRYLKRNDQAMKSVFGKTVGDYFGELSGFTLPLFQAKVEVDEGFAEVLMGRLEADRRAVQTQDPYRTYELQASWLNREMDDYSRMQKLYRS